jgi:hypothetical protein
MGYSVINSPAPSQHAFGTSYHIVVGVANAATLGELRRSGWEKAAPLLSEEFAVTAQRNRMLVLGGDFKGVVYALSNLRRRVALEDGLPTSMQVRRKPVFKVRRWSTSVARDEGEPWDSRQNLAERFSYIKTEILPRASDYGMNSVELNGRPGDGWDVAHVISFEKYPELASLYAAEDRQDRLRLTEDLARAAHDNLLDLLVWSHEVYVPTGFWDLYPRARGKGCAVCVCNPFLIQFMRDKYIEFFKGAPSVDGLVMSVNESGEIDVTHDKCQCEGCREMTPADRTRAALDPVIAIAGELKKQIVLRTFRGCWIHDLHGDPEAETIRAAFTNLSPDVRVMSKYCPMDFYGGAIANDPLIGALPNPGLVEFSLDVEWQGRTLVPVLTPDNFRRRVQYAVQKKCEGVVARVDFPFPQEEPEPLWNHPNDFNAWYMGELLWDPGTDIDNSLIRWARLRYGSEAGPIIAPAFRQTEAITQKIFFTLGQTVIYDHNMIASLSDCDNQMWNHALCKWDPEKLSLCEAFFNPDEDLIRRVRLENRDAVEVSLRGLSQVQKVGGVLPEIQYQRLEYWFEKLRDTAILSGHLTELYLRHRQLAYSPAKPEMLATALAQPNNHVLIQLLEAARLGIQKAIEMEHLHGPDSWPVASPDRGMTAYEFVHQILRYYIGGLTGEKVDVRVTWKYSDQLLTTPVVQSDGTESLWRNLVECGRPTFAIGEVTKFDLKWPEKLREIRIEGSNLALTTNDGRTVALPLAYSVQGFLLSPKGHVRPISLRVQKNVKELVISQRKIRDDQT